jgi:hypothetical protein
MNSVKGKDTIMWKHFITSSIAFFALAVAANAQSHRTIEAHTRLGHVSTTISATNWHNINQRSYDRHYDSYRGHRSDRHYDAPRGHRSDRDICRIDSRRFHQAPAGYYTFKTERVWVPGYWDVSYDRCGDRIRIWIPGGWEIRKIKVWIPYNTRGRR